MFHRWRVDALQHGRKTPRDSSNKSPGLPYYCRHPAPRFHEGRRRAGPIPHAGVTASPVQNFPTVTTLPPPAAWVLPFARTTAEWAGVGWRLGVGPGVDGFEV